MIKNILDQDDLMDRFESLPKALREAIVSVETADSIQAIGEKYKLHIDQIGSLGNETGLVMLGFTRPYLFPAKLAQSLKVPREQASLIAQDINEQIFTKIRDFIEKPNLNSEKEAEKKKSDQIFKEKMTGLFKTTTEETENRSYSGQVDPYNEPIE